MAPTHPQVRTLFFAKERDPSRVVGNASSPRQEIVLSSARRVGPAARSVESRAHTHPNPGRGSGPPLPPSG